MTNIVMIGCGKMGGALLKGWLAQGVEAEFSVVKPSPLGLPAVAYYPDIDAAQGAFERADMLVLAVKPQIMGEICLALKPYISAHMVVLSLAAGWSIERFETEFSGAQPLIRVMPNTPALIGQGMSIGVGNAVVRSEDKALTEVLFKAAGVFQWMKDEASFNAVTPISGCGPAYVFYFIEMLARAGEKAGLEQGAAMVLARQTVIGAAALAAHEDGIDAATLRENVTSPGGITAAALDVLMDGMWEGSLDRAIQAAQVRDGELNA